MCIVRPNPIIIPIFNKLELFLLFDTNFLFTKSLQKIIKITPNIIPDIVPVILINFKLSGIKSKQITAVISPAANCKIKLIILFDFKSNTAPHIPPKVVPIIPKVNPKIVILPILSIYEHLLFI